MNKMPKPQQVKMNEPLPKWEIAMYFIPIPIVIILAFPTIIAGLSK